jgi:putative ABC transport system ATP-binding protein
VFQFFNLIPLLTVRENVALPFLIGGDAAADHQARVGELLEMVGLAGKAEHAPDQLSAGEQQRVALARALATQPALLLADEPTGNLDYTTGGEILDLLWRSCVQLGQTIVLVTHEARAAAYADRVLVVRDGLILDEIPLGRRDDHDPAPLLARLAGLGL